MTACACVKYLGEKSLRSKAIVQIDAHSTLTALHGP